MEGFYLIDHIELRPRRYGLIVKNFKQNVGFKSKLQSYAVIQKTRENIKKYGELLLSYANKGKFVHEVLENGEFQTQLVYKEVIIGTYLNLVPGRNFNKSDRESELKSLFTLITEAGNQKLFSTQIYSKSIIPEEVTDRTFYSFRVSVIVPEWPSRFADPEYHEWLESIFREDAPAHIWIDFHYLDFTKMDQFENLFENWLKECKDSFYDKNRSSNALAIFIKNLESSKINSFHYNE